MMISALFLLTNVNNIFLVFSDKFQHRIAQKNSSKNLAFYATLKALKSKTNWHKFLTPFNV